MERINYKAEWCLVIDEVPNNEREVMVYCESLPEAAIGFYTNNNWIIYLDCEKVELPVVAWKEKPELPNDLFKVQNCLKNAKELRYMGELKGKIGNNQKVNEAFKEIEKKINKAIKEGEIYINVKAKILNDSNVKRVLEEKEYHLIPKDSYYTISWDNY